MMSEITNNMIPNNGVNLTPDRCSLAQQHGPSRQQITAQRIRRKWSHSEYKAVMKCYYESNPNKIGYRKRMHKIWEDAGMFPIAEQHLADQKSQIIKRNWLSKLELEEIRRGIENTPQNDAAASNGSVNGQPHTESESHLDRNNQTINRTNTTSKNPEQDPELTEEQLVLIQKLEIIRSNERKRLPSLRGIDRKRLLNTVEKVDEVLGRIRVSDITDVNELIYCGAALVTDIVGAKSGGNEHKTKNPPWRRRLENQLKGLNLDLSRIIKIKENKYVKRGHESQLQRKYNYRQKGIQTIEEIIRQRIKAKAGKIKRYNQRIAQYQQNRTFVNNEGRFYQQLNEKKGESETPDPKETKSFWTNIWGIESSHNRGAEWVHELQEETKDIEQQEAIQITEKCIKKALKKLSNWKAPGPDFVQGFWIKNFTSLHAQLAKTLEKCLQEGEVPQWMTRGRTVLIQKDKAKGNTPSNYRPITCLPLTWKLLTKILSDDIYRHLEAQEILPEEQKGCRRKCKGTGDLLYIDRRILKEAKKRRKNLAMAWLDYRKAYDMLPHSWIIECLETFKINNKTTKLLEKAMKSWRVQLTCNTETIGEVEIKRGIFQGDSLSPLLFVIAMIPLTRILRKAKPGYEMTTEKTKVNHLMYMDDVKLYGKNRIEIESLIQTVRIYSSDISMEFGLEKCASIILKRGLIVESEGITLPNEETMKNLRSDEEYKYLGVLQAEEIKVTEMKKRVGQEYKRRVRKILETKLNGNNLIKAINTWAVPIVRYSAPFLDWTKQERREMDRHTRKLMTMHKALHPKSDVDRLYISRRDGGRGLVSVEDAIETAIRGLENYAHESEERLLCGARSPDANREKLPVKEFKREKAKEREESWRTKTLHGQFLRQTEDIAGEGRWGWMRKAGLKRETESLILAAQEQAIRTNLIKTKIDRTRTDSKCRMCGQSDETVNHIISECSKMAQKEYKRRHDWVGKRIHWEMCKIANIHTTSKWYEHQPDTVVENDNHKILWDFDVQTDHIIEARRPDLIIINKEEKKCTIVDFAVPYDSRVETKQREKTEKYQDLRREIQKLWNMKTNIVPIIIGALGTPSPKLKDNLQELGLNTKINEIQKTVLLNTARILRKVLEN